MLGNPAGKPAGDLRLRRVVPMLDAVGGDQMDLVGVAAHNVAGYVVGDDPVAAFSFAFRLGDVDDVVRLGRKTDQQPGALRTGGEVGEDVGIGRPGQLGRPIRLLEL